MTLPTSRAEARARGLKRYIGRKCSKGHNDVFGPLEQRASDPRCPHA